MLRHPLVFIRHGETDWNRQGRLQGGQDIPLNATGERQAARNGRVLAEVMAQAGVAPDGFAFVASPLSRCVATMGFVRRGLGLPQAQGVAFDDRLREITFGRWEGHTLDELAAREPQAVAARHADKWGYVPPGGESYAMLAARIRPWLEGLDRPTVAVSHGGVSRVVRGLLFGLPDAEVPLLEVPQDRIYWVEDGQGAWL